VSWGDFKKVYMDAYDGGASGCTTFRSSGKRYGILNAASSEDVASDEVPEVSTMVTENDASEVGGACYYDTMTGRKHCE
jgi:ribonucleoside-diphosphate reductase alpha chain